MTPPTEIVVAMDRRRWSFSFFMCEVELYVQPSPQLNEVLLGAGGADDRGQDLDAFSPVSTCGPQGIPRLVPGDRSRLGPLRRDQ